MTGFDPNAFMQQTIDKELETEMKVCPPGEYKAMIYDFTSDAFEQIDFEYKRGPKAGTPGTMTKFSCPFVIDDDAVKAALGRDQVIVTKDFILDMDGDILATGVNKNVELGKVRAAAGQNGAGPWSVGNLRNSGPFIVKVVHRTGDRKDGTKFTRPEVERVTKLA